MAMGPAPPALRAAPSPMRVSKLIRPRSPVLSRSLYRPGASSTWWQIKNNFMLKYIHITLSILVVLSLRISAQSIRINQLGYYPYAPKIAIVLSTDGSDRLFYLLSPHGHNTTYRGHLAPLLT